MDRYNLLDMIWGATFGDSVRFHNEMEAMGLNGNFVQFVIIGCVIYAVNHIRAMNNQNNQNNQAPKKYKNPYLLDDDD
jgi:hypothetical protein